MDALHGLLAVDLTLYLPGPFASRELQRLGARVVRVEPPGGDPLAELAPSWYAALNEGKETLRLDLKDAGGRERARELCSAADIFLEGFRPGVAERLGLGYDELARGNDGLVYCSITGFGAGDLRPGHDVNYLGWAGVLAETAPELPPVQIADLAAGSLFSLVEVLAALVERGRTGRGRHVVVSMTELSHRLVAHRAGGDPFARYLTGGLACYRIYPTKDGRYVTVGALEPKFFARLAELLGREELAARQYDPAAQDELVAELTEIFRGRPLDEWLERFEGEDVPVGPVLSIAEAARRGR